MPLPCVVRTLSGVKQLVNLYLPGTTPSGDCNALEFSVAGQYVKLNGACGLALSSLSTALDRPVWYNYGRQTVDVAPGLSNGVLYDLQDSTLKVGGTECSLNPTAQRHVLPSGVSDLWANVETAGIRVWEGLLSENDVEVGTGCDVSLYALRGSPGVDASGNLVMVLPQTEMQGMLALVCAAVAAIYLVGSASLYESGKTVGEVHNNRKSTQLFLVDGALTALVSTVSALMIGDPVQQMPWVVWQRAFLCGCVSVLFCLAVYLIYWCPGAPSTTLRTVVELPLLVAVYSPLASSASGVVDLAALLLGLGTILIAMRTPPNRFRPDFYDFTAKILAVWVQAPALLAGVITDLGDSGVAQGVAAISLSLGVCAASMHVSSSSPPSTVLPSQ